jgi:toxin ParE1/3/4
MATVLRTDQAEADLDRILTELAQQSLSAGHRLARLIDQKSQRYAAMSGLGILRDDLAPGLRCFMVWSYLIFYRPIADGIELLRVMHGRQNIVPSHFNPFPP